MKILIRPYAKKDWLVQIGFATHRDRAGSFSGSTRDNDGDLGFLAQIKKLRSFRKL